MTKFSSFGESEQCRWKQSWKQAQQGRREGEAMRQVAEGEYSNFPGAETFFLASSQMLANLHSS